MDAVIDASAAMAAFVPTEPGHAASVDLLARCRAGTLKLVMPTVALPEIAAALARASVTGEDCRDVCAALLGVCGVAVVSLDNVVALQAADIAATCRMRGADACYVALAEMLNVPVVTLDREMLARSRERVEAVTPAELQRGDRPEERSRQLN